MERLLKPVVDAAVRQVVRDFVEWANGGIDYGVGTWGGHVEGLDVVDTEAGIDEMIEQYMEDRT